MAYIKVDINKLGQLESQLNRIPSVISSTASTVRSVRSGLDWDVACEAGIDSTLRRIASDLEACKSRMQNTVRFVDSAVQQYNKVEYGGKNPNSNGGRSSGGGSSKSFIALANSYVSQFWDENFNSKRFSSVADICAALATSPFSALNVYAKKKSYFDIIGDIIKDGFDNTVDFLADQYNIAKDKIKDLGECIKADIIEASNAVVETWKTGATIVKNSITSCVSAIKEDWESKGITYRIANGALAVAKIVGGVATVACAVAGTGITAGLGTPATVLVGTYGANTAISGFADLFNSITGNVDAIGEVNLLESGFKGVCGQVGEWVGNREIGESVGKAIYTVGEISTIVVSLGNLAGQIKQAHSAAGTLGESFNKAKVMVANASKEVPNAVKQLGGIITKTNISEIPYRMAQLTSSVPAINAVISDVSLINKGVEAGSKIIDKGIKVVNTLAGWEMIEQPTFLKNSISANDNLGDVMDGMEGGSKLQDAVDTVYMVTMGDLFDPLPLWDI